MVETWAALTARRNVRTDTFEPIAAQHLDRILQGARGTPSASNRRHAGLVVSWLIALGYPADHPLAPTADPNRRPLDEVVHRGHR